MPTRKEAREALQAAERMDPELYVFLRLEATTGLRPGEVCALWWAELLWRAKTGKTAPKLPVDQALCEGSWLSRLYAAGDRGKRHPIVVRVLEYRLHDPGRPQAAGWSTGW